MATRAPDISERPIIDLTGRSQVYYDPTGNKFDIAIGSYPFIMAATDTTPYKRQTAEFRSQRVDQARDPGEQSLSGSGYWIRSQSSFHYGEGIKFAEPIEVVKFGNTDEVKFRYESSYGINPWTPGELSLLNDSTLYQAFSGDCKVISNIDGATQQLFAADLSTAPTTSLWKISSSGVSSAFKSYANLNSKQILDVVSDGTYLYVATIATIWDIKISDGTLHDHYTINTTDASNVKLAYVKGRVIAGVTRTTGTTAVYELAFASKGAGASANISGITPVNGSTTMPVGWVWTAITESRNAIYVSGYAGDQSSVFKLAVDSTGALGTLITTAVLPRGEIIYSLYGYLGAYVMIGTNKGARVSTANDAGDLSYGALTLSTANPIYGFDGRDSYIWAGVAAEINSYSGTYRINLGQQLLNETYARASDVYTSSATSSITGAVSSVAIFDTDRVAFAVSGSGVWVEHNTNKVSAGTIKFAKIRFDTLENKAWKRIRVRTPDTLNGDVDIFRRGETSDIFHKAIKEGAATNYDYDLAPVFPDVAVDAAFKLTLNRNSTDTTLGAVVYGISVKALPTPTRARVLQIPLFLFDKETDRLGNIVGYDGYARIRLQELETLEAAGDTVIIQDFTNGGEPIEAIIEQVTFTRTTPSARAYTGFGGFLMVVARTVI